jgi:hypothetical protein
MPSAITIFVWKADHLSRSRRAGIIVFIVGVSAVSATLLTVPQLLERIRLSVECLRSGQRIDVLLTREKN